MNFNGHALCQAMKLEGLSDRAEANLEDRIRHLYVNSGPQYVIDVLKVLREHTESQVHNPNHKHRFKVGDPSISWDHKTDRPKHGLGVIYKQFQSPLERLRVIRAVENTIVFETASKKQLQKVISGVRSKKKNDGSAPIRFSDKQLRSMEKILAQEVFKVKPFNATDLTGDMLPYANLTTSIGKEKQAMKYYSTCRDSSRLEPMFRERAHDAARKLDSETKGQFYTAPRISKQYWNRVVSISYRMHGEDKVPKGILYPRKVTPRPIEVRDYQIQSYDGARLSDTIAGYDEPGSADLLGRFDFLQQRGGKLRSVANINRFVNYTMDPYAKMLERSFYHHPSIDVNDQTNALRWVQSKFRRNQDLADHESVLGQQTEIESIDLSSATDLLDYTVFTSALKRDFRGKTGLLEAYASYFEELSSLPLYCEPLNSPIQYSTGQPLGMKGSFQTLTIMNAIAGIKSAKQSGISPNDSFRVVGDDFIADSRITPAYHKIIESWGGKTNEDKAMKSYTHGEFLSKIVTANHIYTLKPKYRLGKHAVFINAEKAKKRDVLGLYRLSKDEKEYLDILSEYSVSPLDSRTSLPRLRSIQTEVTEEELEWVSNALQILADARGNDVSEDISLSDITVQMLHREKMDQIQKTHAPVINDKEIASGPVHLEEATFPTGTDSYNHRTAKREEKSSLKQTYDQDVNRAKDIKKIKQAIAGKIPDEPLDIGYGMTLKAENVALAAIPDIVNDSRRQSSEYQVTRQPSKINSDEAFIREIEDDGPEV